ncbi:hypothetical protein D3C79_845380 [compost metagenome]
MFVWRTQGFLAPLHLPRRLVFKAHIALGDAFFVVAGDVQLADQAGNVGRRQCTLQGMICRLHTDRRIVQPKAPFIIQRP